MTCAVTSRWTPSVPACRVVCENGGSRDGYRCLCPLQYSGTSCERYIRDCTEAYSNGYNNTDLNGPYSIQPRDAPTAFLVLCLFEWGGVTVPFRRQHESWENLDWAEAKAGRTGNLGTGPDPWDFFAGLESLHYLSHQAEYSAHVSLWGGQDGAGVFYQNCTIGDESSSYALTYNVSYPREHTPGDDGFQASSPLSFSTQDRDTHGCAGINGAPGWYGPDCTEYSLFAKPLTWPVLGIDMSFSALEFHWSRDGAFYDGVR
ncbi:fibrinogen-like protein A [Littorina saxatilis]